MIPLDLKKLDSYRGSDCAVSSRTLGSLDVSNDPKSPFFLDQFLAIHESENQSAALVLLDKMDDSQKATLLFLPGANPEYTNILTNSIFKVFATGTPKEKGAAFVSLVESFRRIKFDLIWSLLSTGKDAVEKEQTLEQVLQIARKLNSIRAFAGLDLSGLILCDLKLNYLSLYGDLIVDLSDSIFDDAILELADLSNTILANATFRNADMKYIILTNSIMDDVVLCGANLYRAEVSEEMLANIPSSNLVDAIMPDGKVWSESKNGKHQNENCIVS